MTWEARIALGLLVALVALAVLGPSIAPDPLATGDLARGTLLPPSHLHWLGTDQFARDLFARLAAGARVSLAVGGGAVAVAALLGIVVGLGAGAIPGIIGTALSRVIDLGLALPRLIVLLVFLAALGRVPIVALAAILGATGWPTIARLVRGEALRLRHAPHVVAAEALGAPRSRLVWREILPGTMPPVLVAATLGLADAILLEAGLSFVGVGVRPPYPSWGNMLYESRDFLARDPALLLFPAAALVLATITATLLGDALRRSLEPHHR